MTGLESKIPPPLVAVCVAAAMWAAAGLGPIWPLPHTVRMGLVALLVAAGAACDLAGIWAFRVQRTTINPLRPERSTALVTSGIYRFTRNPMYVGMACFLTAWALYLNAVLALAGVGLFVAYITRFQIRPEERILQSLFGEPFVAYTARVRRWL